MNFALIIITAMHCKGKTSTLATAPYRHGASKCGKCKYVAKYSCASIENVHTSLCDVSQRIRDEYFLHSCLLSLSHVHVQCLGATPSVLLVPPVNYTVFQNDTPAIFYCYGNGLGTGAVVSWSLNGTGYGTQHAQMGITYVIDPPTGATVSSYLIIPTNSTINNNTQVVCRAADVTFSNVKMSKLANLTIQGEYWNIS